MINIDTNILDPYLSGNLIYQTYKNRWQFLYNSYLGGQVYRNAGYLTKYANETSNEYAARCLETPLDNHCKSIINIYNSFLFKEEPEREFGELEIAMDIQDFLDDADLDGRSLDNFMKDVSTWAMVFGHAWVIMTKPNINATSLAEEQMMGIRPYVNMLTPLTVLDWKWERDISGKYVLSMFKYLEDVNGSIHTIKEWTRNAIKTTEYDAETRTVGNEIIENNNLNSIPATIVYGNRSIIRGIGSSSIDDIADLQRFEYNLLSESAQSIRIDSHPTIVATSDVMIDAGAGSIITIPDNLPGDLKPYVMSANGANIASIVSMIDKSINAIDKAACVEGIRSKETRNVSGVVVETEFQTLNAILNNISTNLEDAEEQLWDIYCLYQQYPDCIEVKYPQTFGISDDDREIDKLVKMKSAATDPIVLRAIDVNILEQLDLDEDEIVAIKNQLILNPDSVPEMEDYMVFEPKNMILPETGDIVLVNSAQEQLKYAELGYIIEE